GCAVERVSSSGVGFTIHTRRGDWTARQGVSALPASLTARIAPQPVAQALAPFLSPAAHSLGSALARFLGVPQAPPDGQPFTHHQLLQDYDRPLGYGNNMFISASAPGDTQSAPDGHRAVMISTHCDLESWERLVPEVYAARKREVGEALLRLARRVYP